SAPATIQLSLPDIPSSPGSDPAEAPAVEPPIDDLLTTDSERAAQYMIQGDDALEADRLPEAVAAYRESLRFDPTSEAVHFNLAIALTRMGRSTDALEEYREALKLAPDYAEAHNNLGNLLVKMNRVEEA